MGRIAALLAIVWALGFFWFAGFLPQPLRPATPAAEGVIVPTGGPGRIARGLEVLAEGGAGAMLVTGVDPEVRETEFADEFDVPMRAMRCCVTLGQSAADTRGNADETAAWVAERGFTRLRLVTTDWHMRRAAAELTRALPGEVSVLRDAVPSDPSLATLLLEYHKLLAVWAVGLYRWATA